MLLTERHSGRTRGLYCGGMSPQSNANLPQNPSLRLNKVKSGGRGSPRPDRSELESCNKNEEIYRNKAPSIRTSGVAQLQPGQALLREDVPRRPKLGGVPKGADVEKGFGRRGVAP